MTSNNGRSSSMIPNGTVASECLVRSIRALDLLTFCVADGQITSPMSGCYVLDQSQGANLLHQRASTVRCCALWRF